MSPNMSPEEKSSSYISNVGQAQKAIVISLAESRENSKQSNTPDQDLMSKSITAKFGYADMQSIEEHLNES